MGGDATALCADALTFLAADPERLSRFLAVTGLGAGNLREAAAQPGFGTGVLAYLADDEPLLVAFAERQGTAPDQLGQWIAELRHGSGWVDP